MYSVNPAGSHQLSRSLEHVGWGWGGGGSGGAWQARSTTALHEPEIRNGWLTLPREHTAKFQERRLLEREQKMVAVYEAQQARALGRVTSTTAIPPGSGVQASTAPSRQPGKVRQMFEERRTKAGIDKSHPPQPIQSVERAAPPPRRAPPNGHARVAPAALKVSAERKPPSRPAAGIGHPVRKPKSEALVNGSGDVNHNTRPNPSLGKVNGVSPEGRDATDGATAEPDRLGNIEDETFPEELAPSPTPRSERSAPPPPRAPVDAAPPLRATRAPPLERRSPAQAMAATRSSPALTKTPIKAPARPPRSTPTPPPRRTASDNVVSPTKAASGGRAASSASASGGGGGAGEPCAVCGRRFARDRLDRHQEICRKANTKRRKPYDALKHRLVGTEAEPFIRQIRKLPPPGKAAPAQSAAKKPLNSSWRQKHEEFIRAIRAAKEAQAYVAAGGKLSDLPPPPPSENPDYVQCPHCSRRFNEAAAQRHIPKCQNYMHNKKAPPQKRR